MDDALGLAVVFFCLVFWVAFLVGAAVLAGVVLVLWALMLVSAWVYRACGGKDWR